MRFLLPLVLLASIACAAENPAGGPPEGVAAPSDSVHTAVNPAASFSRYRSFSFGPSEGPPAGYQTTARTAEVQRRLRPLIAAALTQKGYSEASAMGDLMIMFGSGRREVVTHDVSSVSAGWLPDDENADFIEGSLVIDAFDGATLQRVWHGASRVADIKPDQIDDQRLQRSVSQLISAFPAMTAAAQK
jgi:hypothetical protein